MSYVKLRPRRSTPAQWQYANPVLAEGEMGVEVPETGVGTGLVNFKFGDGVRNWNDLPYGFNAADLNDRVTALQATVDGYDEIIHEVEETVEDLESKIVNIRKMDIQKSEPPEASLVLGEIWIETDIMTGSMNVEPSTLSMAPGDTQTITVYDTFSPQVSGFRWTNPRPDVVELSASTGRTVTARALYGGESNVSVSAFVSSGGQESIIATQPCKITVSLSGDIYIMPTSLVMYRGNSAMFTCDHQSLTTFDRIEWISRSQNIVTVKTQSTENATIEALNVGVSTIIVRAILNDVVIASKSATVTVKGLSFPNPSETIEIHSTQTITLNNPMSKIHGDYDRIDFVSDDETKLSVLSHTEGDSAIGTPTTVTIKGEALGTNVNLKAYVVKDDVVVQDKLNDTDVTIKGRIMLQYGTQTNPDNIVVDVGAQPAMLQLINEYGGFEYDNVVWTSSDDSTIELSSKTNTSCYFQAKKMGEAVVTVTLYKQNGEALDSKSVSIYGNGSLYFPDGSITMTPGVTIEISAQCTLLETTYTRFDWSKSEPDSNFVFESKELSPSSNPRARIRAATGFSGPVIITLRAYNGDVYEPVAEATLNVTVQ